MSLGYILSVSCRLRLHPSLILILILILVLILIAVLRPHPAAIEMRSQAELAQVNAMKISKAKQNACGSKP